MFKFDNTRRVVVRVFAVLCLIGVPMTGVVAAATLSDLLQDEKIIWVAEGESEFEVPDPGAFGSSSTVWGSTDEILVSPDELGCRLLSRDGQELSSVHLSHLSVVTTPSITVDGIELSPLFEVSSEAKGNRVHCDNLDEVTPIGYSASPSFGSSTAGVFMMSLLSTLTLLVLGPVLWFTFAPEMWGVSAGRGLRF